jgi:mono/diheme cytochrome c family protein
MRSRRSVFLALVILAACGNDTGMGDDVETPPEETDGAKLFAENCGNCHGADGAGTLEDGPQIQSPVRGFATYVVRTGRGKEMGFKQEMEPFSTADLSDRQLTSILDFLSAVPHPTTGQGLYLRFCGNCHGANAQGGRVGESVAREESDEIDEKVREGHGGTNYASREKYMPAWSSAELTTTEVQLITEYLGGLPPGPGDDDDDDDDDTDEGVDEGVDEGP